MRYILKFSNGQEIITDLETDQLSEVLKRERELRAVYGEGNVWYEDTFFQITIG